MMPNTTASTSTFVPRHMARLTRLFLAKASAVIMQVQRRLPAPAQFSMMPIADDHDSAFGGADMQCWGIGMLTLAPSPKRSAHHCKYTPTSFRPGSPRHFAYVEFNGSLQHMRRAAYPQSRADVQYAILDPWPATRARHADMSRHLRLTPLALQARDAGRNCCMYRVSATAMYLFGRQPNMHVRQTCMRMRTWTAAGGRLRIASHARLCRLHLRGRDDCIVFVSYQSYDDIVT